jgi:hypothetical protein
MHDVEVVTEMPHDRKPLHHDEELAARAPFGGCPSPDGRRSALPGATAGSTAGLREGVQRALRHLLNHAQYPSDVIALVVLWRLRYRLTLGGLAEMFLQRGIIFSYEAVREWEAKLAPALADELRHRRHGKRGTRGRRWHAKL